MNKNSLILKLLHRKDIKDYSYAIFFFLLSSIFALFAIKPALTIGFSLQKQADELKVQNKSYENNIIKLVALQNNLEKIQDKKYLLNESLPILPETKTFIDDIKRSASQEGILIKNLSLSKVDLKNIDSKEMGVLMVNMEIETDFLSVNKFFKGLLDQRRIKDIKNLSISSDLEATDSGKINITFDIQSFYL